MSLFEHTQRASNQWEKIQYSLWQAVFSQFKNNDKNTATINANINIGDKMACNLNKSEDEVPTQGITDKIIMYSLIITAILLLFIIPNAIGATNCDTTVICCYHQWWWIICTKNSLSKFPKNQTAIGKHHTA